jgi:hypothetical protein
MSSSPRWSRPGCPKLVAGSGKQVEVVVMATDVHENLPMMGHVTGRAVYLVTAVNYQDQYECNQ